MIVKSTASKQPMRSIYEISSSVVDVNEARFSKRRMVSCYSRRIVGARSNDIGSWSQSISRRLDEIAAAA